MKKIVIPFVEMMSTQVCNLVCPGCSTYSDLNYKGYVTWEQAKTELEPWLDRVEFEDFGVMGGEPLINPKIKDWLVGIRKLMPNTTIRFPVNGTLLHKHLDIVDLLSELGNVIFKITVHIDDQNVEDSIAYIKNRFNWEPIYEYGINRYVTSNNFKFQVNRPVKFYKTFCGEYNNASPYNSDPQEAFLACHQKLCPLLFNGRIYKCSTSGLMNNVLAMNGYPNKELWETYLDNKQNGSISLQSSDLEIQNFVNNIGKHHATCKQCPTKETITEIDHLNTVYFRKKP